MSLDFLFTDRYQPAAPAPAPRPDVVEEILANVERAEWIELPRVEIEPTDSVEDRAMLLASKALGMSFTEVHQRLKAERGTLMLPPEIVQGTEADYPEFFEDSDWLEGPEGNGRKLFELLGPVLGATAWKTNADMIVDLVRLGYLRPHWSTIDATYGRGIWWKKWAPDVLTKHDKFTLDGVDFRDLPHEDDTFDVGVLDAPYVCVDEATEILTIEGWRRHDQIAPGQLVYTLNHEKGAAEWQPIERVIKLPAIRRQMLSLESRGHSSLTTLDHRWPILRRRSIRNKRQSVPEFATSQELVGDDRVPIGAEWAGAPERPTYSDALVELVAWFWTEGTLGRRRDGSKGTYGNITQSHIANPANCEAIRRAFESEFGPETVGGFPRQGRAPDDLPRWRMRFDGPHKTCFVFSAGIGRIFAGLAPDRVPSESFLLALTPLQLSLFITKSLDADGHRSARGATTLGQKNKKAAEAFQFACTLAGIPTSLRAFRNGPAEIQWTVRLRTSRTFRVGQQSPSIVEHDGMVWCVTTANSTWLARRNGSVYFTGNCTGGKATSTLDDFNDRYGLHSAETRTPAELRAMNHAGLTEVARVVKPRQRGKESGKGLILVKAMPYVSSGKLQAEPDLFKEHARSIGLHLVDEFVHLAKAPRMQPSKNPDGTPRAQKHARRNYSMLLVFQKR